MKEPFIKAKPIIETLIEAGFEAYFVGGSVRDYLLGRSIGDVDIATSALPEDVQQLFPKTIPVGIKHGTVIVVHQDECYEVTTFRVDGDYQDFRRPSKVEFVSSLKADLSRRDFTINAIAMDLNGVIIDPFDGQSDLEKKYIQAVGNPDERFLEDPLRMMRAIRFVSQLDFELCRETKASIEKNACYLSKISVERILIEFEKLLTGTANQKAIMLIVELQVNQHLPQLANKSAELIQFAELCSKQSLNLYEMWTLLIILLEIKEVEPFFKEWKSSNERMRACKNNLQVLMEIKKQNGLSPFLIYTYGYEVIKSCISIYSILESKDAEIMSAVLEKMHGQLPIATRKELAISGNDLIEWFNKSGGPWLSNAIEKVERAVVSGEVLNTKTDIKEWLLRCNPQFENNF